MNTQKEVTMKKKLTALIAAAAIAVSCLFVPTYAEEQEISDAFTDNVSYDVGNGYRYSLPDNMRAAFLTPSVDYFKDGSETDAELSAALSDIFTRFAEIGLNAVIINTVSGENAYYDLGSDGTDPVSAAIQSAYEHGISPFVVFDLSHALSGCSSDSQSIDTLISKTHRFAMKYVCDGIILDDYYMRRDVSSFGGYMCNGSGVGYKNWLYDTSEQYFRTASDVIRRTNNSIAAGIMINDMWANASVNEAGSSTEDSFQAYYDGYTDTKSFVENGYADFALVRAYGSLTSSRLAFESVTGWWGDLTGENGIPMYIVHHNEYVGTSTVGWSEKDQLVKQLTAAKEIKSYSGSVFNSFETLESDPLGSTEAVTAYFAENAAEEQQPDDAEMTISDDVPEVQASAGEVTTAAQETEARQAAAEQREQGLKMTSPAHLTFTTNETNVTFMGSFDKNYPVYFNGEELSLNDAGNFYFEQPLEAGLNTFTVSHKSKTYTYNITRKITVLRSIGGSVSEGKTLSVDGGTKINISAKAYKGATVYATVNGTTVTMTAATAIDEDEDANSSYVRYTGTYTVPDGIIGQTQQLGTIMLYGSYGGYSMSAKGAAVVVNAKPEPVKQAAPVVVSEAPSVGSGEVVATLETTHSSDESVKYVRTLYDNTIVYDGKTADDIPSPIFSQLPANALEIYKSTSGSYYVTESGKRIAQSASVLETGAAIDKNKLFVRSIGTSNGNSYIKIQMDRKTGFNMRLAGNTYYTAWDGDYNVSSFTATHLYITFENVTSVTSLPSFDNNYVFKSGKWDTVTEENGTKFRLILELRQPGVYFGHGSRYDAEGCLILSFPVPINNLSGLTIVIDPGHGYGKSADKLDPGAIGEVVEQEVVLAISKELASQLSAAGANVVRLKTESEFLLTKQRPTVARGYGCDIYLSIHANKAWGASSGTARGTEAYYFTSYSQPLAASISAEIAAYCRNSVYTDYADKNRGAKYSYYHVTLQQDFPSVLVETGFVDNIQDAMALASETHRKGIAAAIVNGIKKYISRSSISYAPEGYDAAQSPTETTMPAATAAETSAPVEAPAETSASSSETEESSAPEESSQETTTTPEADEVENVY